MRRLPTIVGFLCVLLLAAGPASSQTVPGDTDINPVTMLEDLGEAVGGVTGTEVGLSGTLNILILLTILSLAPAIIIMCTSFVRIIIVLGLLKQAMGTQSLPPPQVITGLALIMTLFVMSPTIDRIYNEALVPYQNGEITNQLDAWQRAKQPVRDFMFDQIEATGNWSSLFMILDYRGVNISSPEQITRADVDMLTLVPAYVLSELKVGFLMGFRVYLPFLVIDMIIASVLISMGMMMLPPVLVSAPFKILLFIMVDGWQLVIGNLMQSVIQPGQLEPLSSMVG
ncbi:MAG: flagellar type III secretion system pore protein FliP [Phycisphaerales bacterium]|nr:flagellar type III secretion system pore protein FliP [Phycisphaerales bacterium]